MLLLQGCGVQHQVLLLSCVHLLKVLCSRAGGAVQCLLNYLHSMSVRTTVDRDLRLLHSRGGSGDGGGGGAIGCC